MVSSFAQTSQASDLLSPEFRERLRRLRLGIERVSPSNTGTGTRVSRRRGQGLEFIGHRAYSPGDDIRTLDWNAHARLEQLVVKQFAIPGEVTLVLAPDCSPTMDFGTPHKFQHVRTLAAALGSMALASQDRVMLAPIGPRRDNFSAHEHPRHETVLLHELSQLAPSRALRKSAQWLGQIGNLTGDALVVVLSDFIHQAPLFEIIRELKTRRAHVLAIHVFAPQELSPPTSGRTDLKLIGPFGRETLRMQVDAETRRRYREELDRYRQAIAAACARLGVGHFETCSVESMETLMVELVTMGAVRVRSGR